MSDACGFFETLRPSCLLWFKHAVFSPDTELDACPVASSVAHPFTLSFVRPRQFGVRLKWVNEEEGERGEEESESDYDNVDDDGDAAPLPSSCLPWVASSSPVSGAAPEVGNDIW